MLKKNLLSIFVLLVFLTACSKYSDEEKDKIVTSALDLVKNKAEWRQVIPLYKKLTEIEPANSENRQKVLGYLLEDSLRLVKERKAHEALEFSFELDKLIPGDFYIQNRILGAYRVLAEDAIEKKDWARAEEILYKKALTIRFDNEVMRTYLKLRKLMAEEAISQRRIEDAKRYLDEIILIANIEENRQLYLQEKAEAEKLFKRLQ